MDGDAEASACRDVTLKIRRTPADAAPQVEREHDEASFDPSLRFAVPSRVRFSEGDPHKVYSVIFGIDAVRCTYATDGSSTSLVGHFVSCTNGAVPGDVLAASKLTLDFAPGPDSAPISARVAIDEAPPCTRSDGGSADASVDSSVDAGYDAGEPEDAGQDSGTQEDAGSPCSPVDCASPHPCLRGTCTPQGCVYEPNAGAQCAPGTACRLPSTCDSAGVCQPGALIPVTSTNECTRAYCDEVLGAVVEEPLPAGTACGDATNLCLQPSECDGAGTCVTGAPVTCTTTNPCQVARCEPTLGCVNEPRPNGTSCEPVPDRCDGTSTCQSGACVAGTPPVPDDGDACTADACHPTLGVTHTPIPGCTPTRSSQAFETRASLMGRLVSRTGSAITGATFRVTEAMPPEGSGLARSDVSVSTGPDGSFRLRLTTFPDVAVEGTPPVHVVLRVEAPGVLPVFRDAWLKTGSAVDLGPIKMIPRDAAVTRIGPAGGVANDSRGLVQVVVPAGALAADIDVVITPFDARDEFTSPLPDSTVTMYGFELEPEGTTFAQPVTVRVANTKALPTSLVIPTGYYDATYGRWEHVAQATWDGARFAFQTDHFSPYDCNAERPRGPKPRPDPSPPPNGPQCNPSISCCANDPQPSPGPPPPPGGDEPGNQDCGSDAALTGGGLRQHFALPTYTAKNERVGVTLNYNSGLGGSRTLGTPPSDYQALGHTPFAVPVRGLRMTGACVPSASSTTGLGTRAAPAAQQPGLCAPQPSCALGQATPLPLELRFSVGGSTSVTSQTVGANNTSADFSSFFTLTSQGGEVPSPGLYTTRVVLDAKTPGSCIGSGGTFGVSDEHATPIQTSLEGGPLATFEYHELVSHRLSSPYGAGWTIRELSRVYRAGDVAYLVHGDGSDEKFRPRGYPKPLAFPGVPFKMARDPLSGEIFFVSDAGTIARVNPSTGALTTVLSGLPFGMGVRSVAVTYVGSARHFVVGLDHQLVDVDAGGAPTVLSTWSPAAQYQETSVAARGDLVFFTDAQSPVLRTTRLSDPSHAITSASQLSGGDIRFYPRTGLAGVTFADPRGLTFAPDGTLYLADVRRNAVYAITPQSNGEIGATSSVRPAVGDGTSAFLAPLGERYPGVKLPVSEPLDVTLAEDGTVFVVTAYGLASYDPIAREAEWLVWWGGVDEMLLSPANVAVGVLALDAGSLLVRSDVGGIALMRLDIDRLSSELEPTRTLKRLAGGGLELVDTTAEKIERFDAAGRITERRRRTGELFMGFSYLDAQSDKLDFITDPAGGRIQFGYDGSGKLASISDPAGRTTNVTVDGAGDLVSFREPANETYAFSYDAHRMTQKTSPKRDVTAYTFHADGTVESATKPGGQVMTFDAVLSHPPAFDPAGKIVRSGSFVDGHGVSHEIVVNPRGDIERDTYTADGVTRVDEAVYAFANRSFDRPLQDKDFTTRADLFGTQRLNAIYRVAYRVSNGVPLSAPRDWWDGHGRPIREHQTGAATDNHFWAYRDDGRLAYELVGVNTIAPIYERDAAGRVTRKYDSFAGASTGNEMRWTYRPDGQGATATEHDVTRTFQYDDALGSLNLLGWTDSIGRSMTYERDLAGNITKTDDGTAVTFAAYDAHNRLLESRDALGNATTYGYSHAGCGCSQDNLVTSIHTPDLPDGVAWAMTYDPDGRLAAVTDPHGFTESYEYEPTGQLKKTRDKLARDTVWTHDQLGRVASMVDTLGRKHGNAYPVPGPNLVPTPIGFINVPTALGPSMMAGSGDATAPATSLSSALRSGEYQIGQNALPREGYPANITFYRDATFELGFSRFFDSNRRMTERFDRIGTPITSTALPTLNEALSTPHKWTSQDSWNLFTAAPVRRQITSRSETGAPELGTFAQNAFFEDVSADGFGNPSMVEQLIRDTAGRVAEIRRFHGGFEYMPRSTYTYRPDGRVGRLANVDGVHDFTYDSRGLVETQTVSGEGVYRHGYDAMGRNVSLTFPDGHTRTQQFDDLGRLTSRCYDYGLGTVRCYTAQYDAVGNPVRMTDPDGVDVLAYDALDRLTKVSRYAPDGVTVTSVEDYAYNALGALKLNAGSALDDQRPRLDGAGLADAAVPASLGGQPVTLDQGGFVTSLRGAALAYSQRGMLKSVTPPIPEVGESYGYDAELRRAQRIAGSQVEFYLHEGLDRVATFADVPGPALGTFVPGALRETWLFDGIDHPLRLKNHASGVVAYYELDLAGNVRALRASGGADLGGYRYSAFGKTVEDTTTLNQPLRWKGRWFSNVAGGVYDVRARQWSPELGVFLAVDEFRYHDQDATLWSWPKQNPMAWVDPSGRLGLHTLCFFAATYLATENFGSDDKKKHCYSSCFFNRCTLLIQPHGTIGGGFFWEAGTGGFISKPGDSVLDLKADAEGIKQSYDPTKSCKNACDTCPLER